MSCRRVKYHCTSIDPQAQLNEAREFVNQHSFLNAIDIYEHLSKLNTVNQIDILSELHDVYLLLKKIQPDRYSLYQERIFNFKILNNDKVLDIGSGHLPFPLATHLSDISLTNHAYGRAGIPFKHVNGKEVFEFNIESIPFDDKFFDFSYCSHVLEHSHNPVKACNEIMRVSRRGYIETPLASKDQWLFTAKSSQHTMKVELSLDNVLTFEPYREFEFEGIGSDILLQMHINPQTKREKAFSALIYLYPERFNTMLYWENKFSYAVKKSVEKSDLEVSPVHCGSEYGGWSILPNLLSAESNVISVGIGEDITFDLDLIKSFGCTVHAFDPTPKSIEWLKHQILPSEFCSYGIGLLDYDGFADFNLPLNSEHVSASIATANHLSNSTITVPVISIASLIKGLGFKTIDLLKIDIEGSEYQVIDDMLAKSIKPQQLLIEFHHRFESIGADQTRQAIHKLQAAGYHIFHEQNNFQEVCFALDR